MMDWFGLAMVGAAGVINPRIGFFSLFIMGLTRELVKRGVL